jgi:hypothetical protein
MNLESLSAINGMRKQPATSWVLIAIAMLFNRIFSSDHLFQLVNPIEIQEPLHECRHTTSKHTRADAPLAGT